MPQDHSDLAAALDAAIQAEERDRVHAREVARARREERESIISCVRELHDRVLRLEAAGAAADAPIAETARAVLQHLLGELESALGLSAAGGTEDPPPAPVEACERPSQVREIVAHPAPGLTVPGRELPTRASAAAPEPVAEPPRPPAPPDVEDILEPVYQEILTLEENEELLDDRELHQRVDLLLARLREVQDGPLGERLSDEDRRFMTTRFGLLGNLQKRRRLGFLSPLNRNFQTDWPTYAARLSDGLPSLDERLKAVRVARDREADRRRAAHAHAARRRLEGEELFDELRFFVHGPELQTPDGIEAFRRLVSDCVDCLGTDREPLIRLLEPYQELLEGRDLKSLRRVFRKQTRATPDETHGVARAAVTVPTPSAEADREEALRGAFSGRSALVVGGHRREKADEILVEHLGLDELTWVPASELAISGPAKVEVLLRDANLALVVVLAESLTPGLVERILESASKLTVAVVAGGQGTSAIFDAISTARPDSRTPATNGVASVDVALTRALEEFPEHLVASFNSASRAKDYPFEDPQAVYDALRFLATTYRDARAGRASCPDLDHSFREACGFNYSAHQSASTVGQFPEAYVTTWHNQRHELMEHVGRGSGRDPRHSIRIAFTYLPEEDAVLLGFLGQHQRTRAT